MQKWLLRDDVRSCLVAGQQQNRLANLRRSYASLDSCLVCVTEPHHDYRYPIWQFQPDGQPVALFAEILSILREYGIYLNNDRRITGWGE